MKKRYGLYLVLLFGGVLFFGFGCFDDEDLGDKVTIFNSTDETVIVFPFEARLEPRTGFSEEIESDQINVSVFSEETGELLVEKTIGKGETLVIERPEVEEEED